MLVIRFKIKCKPGKIEQAASAFREAIAPSRSVDGVINFDIARDLLDPDSIIATEVFNDRDALSRQESLPIIQKIIEILPDLISGEPEATIYHVSSSEPWG